VTTAAQTGEIAMPVSPTDALLVRKRLDLACTPTTAFRVFTERFGSWWPLETHVIGEAVDCAVEAGVGGRIYQRDADGQEIVWGRILLWEPPAELRFSWHLRHDESLAQEVTVRFEVDGPGTRFTLEHRGFERRGDEAPALYESYRVGWDPVLAGYLAAAAAATVARE
jgi:uncharacterized protein YndB with AHSA1/START domain